MSKKIIIVSAGMNGFETMIPAGIKAVKECDELIGARRITDLFKSLGKTGFISYNSIEITEHIKNSSSENIVVLMSGDCGFYSGAEQLLSHLENYETEIICGISSPMYLCSKLKIPWQDMKFISLHGKENNIVRHVCRNKQTFFLLGGRVMPKEICERLCEYDLSNLTVHIGENLGSEEERISSSFAENFTNFETSSLCVMIVENENFEKEQISCIPDERFIREKIPMTKAEVRCVCVSKLAVSESDICWDIGGGTGSVSVELAMKCVSGKVYCVEKNPEAVKLIEKNRRFFRCDNIEIICGQGENIVEELPMPNCVFIGGSGGTLKKIIKTAYFKNHNVKIIITAVTLDTLYESISAFEELSIFPEITQIGITRTNKVGKYNMMRAENPIFIISRGADTQNE